MYSKREQDVLDLLLEHKGEPVPVEKVQEAYDGIPQYLCAYIWRLRKKAPEWCIKPHRHGNLNRIFAYSIHPAEEERKKRGPKPKEIKLVPSIPSRTFEVACVMCGALEWVRVAKTVSLAIAARVVRSKHDRCVRCGGTLNIQEEPAA